MEAPQHAAGTGAPATDKPLARSTAAALAGCLGVGVTDLGALATALRAAARGAEAAAERERRKHAKGRRKQAAELDWGRYRTRLVALELLYAGWGWHGFAAQDKNGVEKTIEAALFAALRATRLVPQGAAWAELQYTRCGRTDKGVSALSNVVALRLRSARPAACELPDDAAWEAAGGGELDYCGLINRQLPDGIRVLGWAPAPEGFSARFGCAWRHYRYYFPLEPGLDLARMRDAAARLVGAHDFRNFCRMDVEAVHSFERTVLSAEVLPDPAGTIVSGSPMHYVSVRGSAFLWHQVRCMAAVLFLVARGREEPDVVNAMLDVGCTPRKPQYDMAPEEPLLLHTCGFNDLPPWRSSDASREYTELHLRGLVAQYATRAASLSCAVDRVSGRAAPASTPPQREGEQRPAPEPRGQPRYVPLLKRKAEQTYEERVAKLATKKRVAAQEPEPKNGVEGRLNN